MNMENTIIKKPIPNNIVVISGRSIIECSWTKNIQMGIPELSIIHNSIYMIVRSIFGI
jgi:hypothetical protein